MVHLFPKHGTSVPKTEKGFQEVPQVYLIALSVSAEMKNKKTMMVLALILVSTVTMTVWGVEASGNKMSKYMKTTGNNINIKNVERGTPQVMNSKIPSFTASNTKPQLSTAAESVKKTRKTDFVYKIDDIQLEEPDSEVFAEIDALVKEYEKLPEEERKPHFPGLWVVVARGFSWKTVSYPETSDVAPECIPMGMRFFAKAIWGNSEWTLYRLGRGVVGHDGERYRVDGYALYKKETGRFYLVLDGEGASIQAVGKVYGSNADLTSVKCRRCLHLAMKGRMSIDGDRYVFGLRGFAYRIPRLRAKPIEEAKPQITN